MASPESGRIFPLATSLNAYRLPINEVSEMDTTEPLAGIEPALSRYEGDARPSVEAKCGEVFRAAH